jgi:hypothetical protein
MQKKFIIPNSVGISSKIIAIINDKYNGKFIPIFGLEKRRAINNIIIPGNKCKKIIIGIENFTSRLIS